MRDRKISFRVFMVPEWKKEQEYLRKQHKCGWKFTKVNFGICYHFEKCEPEDVVYQLDYNQDGNWVYPFKIPIAIVMRRDLSLIIL